MGLRVWLWAALLLSGAAWAGQQGGPASDLQSATTIVHISASPAPSSGQVLTATSNVNATWQAAGTPAGVVVLNPATATTLQTIAGPLTAHTGSQTGTITADYFVGNGAGLTNLPATDLTAYAKLDGSNQPFTGALKVRASDDYALRFVHNNDGDVDDFVISANGTGSATGLGQREVGNGPAAGATWATLYANSTSHTWKHTNNNGSESGWVDTSGATTGATGQAQPFTNGIVSSLVASGAGGQVSVRNNANGQIALFADSGGADSPHYLLFQNSAAGAPVIGTNTGDLWLEPAGAVVLVNFAGGGTTPLSCGNDGTVFRGTSAIIVSQTAQSADITTTTITGTAGLYQVNYQIADTAADALAGAATVTISWTDDVGATTKTTTQLLTGTGRTTATFFVQVASGNLTYAVSHTGIFGTATYSLYITAQKLN